MLGVIIGVSSVVTIVSLGEGLKHKVTGQISQLGNNVLTIRPGQLVNRNAAGNISSVNLLAFLNSSTLSSQDVSALGKVSSVTDVVPVDFVTSSAQGDYGSSNNVAVLGTTANFGSVLNLKLGYGAFYSSTDNQDLAVIGSGVAAKLFHSQNPFAHTIKIEGESFIIRGVLSPTSGGLLSLGQTDFNSAVFVPINAAKRLTNGNVNIQQIMVRATPSANINQVAADVSAVLNADHHGHQDYTILKQYELLDLSDHVVNSLTGFITSIAAISLLVGGFGIMDIMLVAVSERTREIGVRKAIGATNRQILNQFLTEGLVLSVGGGLVGVFISLVINLILKLYTGLNPVIDIWIVLIAVGVSILVGVVFSGVPALKAARKTPIEALRGE